MNIDRLKSLMINEEGFAFDPRSGSTYSINPSGLLVINCLKAGASTDQIVGQLTEHFDVDERTASRDLEAFLHAMSRYKLAEREVAP